MSDPIDIKAHDAQNEKGISQVEDSHNLDIEAKIEAFKAAAMAAEVEEQQSGVLQAVKEYPMAAMWAFIMSCTIVRLLFNPSRRRIATNVMSRSWRPTVCSL